MTSLRSDWLGKISETAPWEESKIYLMWQNRSKRISTYLEQWRTGLIILGLANGIREEKVIFRATCQFRKSRRLKEEEGECYLITESDKLTECY